MDSKEIKGYCEMFNKVLPTSIILHDEEDKKRGFSDFSWFTDNDFNDYSDKWEEYMEACKGKLYLTLDDYKKDKFVNLNDWKNQ